jgi:hypothetical protein
MIRAISPKPKLRTCANRACRNKFEPTERHPFAVACCTGCEIILAKQHIQKIEAARERKARREVKAQRMADKERLIQLEPLEYFHKLAERAFNAFIRARDADKPCISCGRSNAEKWDAGHYIAVGANRTLRYDEDNVHKQCSRPCNKDKGGNSIEYRKELLNRIGVARLERLEGWHAPRKWTREELLEIQATYKAKLKLAMNKEEVE